MNKTELIAAVAAATDLSKKDAEKAVTATIDALTAVSIVFAASVRSTCLAETSCICLAAFLLIKLKRNGRTIEWQY